MGIREDLANLLEIILLKNILKKLKESKEYARFIDNRGEFERIKKFEV